MAVDKFIDFSKRLHQLSGVDLSHYKRPQMERRLAALMERAGFDDFERYAAAIEHNPDLLAQLLDRMTINVSEFFRNAERWDAVTDELRTVNEWPLRIWSAGCSTGEEPYTIAILMDEVLSVPYQILATDLDNRVLSQAERGHYKAHQLKQVPDTFRSQCFQVAGDTYILEPHYRRNVAFQQHNLLSDVYPRGLHLIACRNVLIYFTEDGKRVIFEKFCEALQPGGLLFVGSTEQLLQANRYGFEPIRPFLYRKQG